MAYLFYVAIPSSPLSVYQVYGFDPVAGTWTQILTPNPAWISGYALEGIARLSDGKTYLSFGSGAPLHGRVKFHLGSSWADQSVGESLGDQMHFVAMRAFAGGHFYFMNNSWGTNNDNKLYYWNGTSLATLGIVSTNIQRMASMDGESKDLFYMCGWRPAANCLYRWNGTTIDHIGDSGGPGGGSFGGVGAIGNDIYLQAFSEDFSYWGTQCCKLKKGTWGGSWSTLRDFTTTYGQGVYTFNSIAIDRSNNNIWVLLKRLSDNHVFACRYNGSSWTDYDLYALLPTMQPNNPRSIAAVGGKCMVASNIGTGSSIRTCYFDGTSWSVVTITGASEGDIPAALGPEPFIGYSPCDIPSTTSRLLNLFDTGTTMRSHPGNGTITYPGIYARLTAPNSANCQFYIGDGAGRPPLLYERIGALIQEAQPPQPMVFETRLGSFSGTTALRIAGLALFTTPYTDVNVPWYSYQFGWYKNDGKLHVWYDYPTAEVELFTAVTVADPIGTPHRYRIYWNPYSRPLYIPELNLILNADQLCFAYSLNECSTWVSLGVRNRDFSFDNVYAGIYVRKWETSAVNAVADFDYFSVRQYLETQQVLAPKVGQNNPESIALEDQVAPLTLSGPTRFDYDIGGDFSFTPPTAVVFEDQSELLTQGGVPRFDLPEISEAPIVPTDRMAFEDGLHCHLDDSEFVKSKFDSDGKELVGYTSIRQILFYDATADPWHTHGAGFYGVGRDGKLYYDGQECGPGSFGTLANGRRKTAWATVGDFVDTGFTVVPTITADDEMQCALLVGQANSGATSRLRWFLTGDFDIQMDYEIVSTGGGPTDGGLYLFAYMDPNNCFYVRRHMWGGSGQTYDKDVRNNGSWGSWAQVLTADTTGKIRLTRVGSTVAAYYWTGAAWAQIGSNSVMTYARPMFVDCFLSPAGGTANVTVKLRNFTINSGATTNLIGWAREAAGTYRGAQAAFPEHALICSSGNGLDIIDADTQKLWMSFRGGTNNFVGGDGNYYIPQVSMKDGVLFASYRTFDTAVLDGWAAWIDFTLDFMRLHRGPSYGDAGLIYNVELTTGVWPRDSANGAISWRNSARAWLASFSGNWAYQNMRVNWCDLLHNGGFQYRAVANNGGTYLAKWQRWKFEGATNANLNTPTKGVSTKTTAMWWVLFDPTTLDLFYHDRTKLYIVYFTTWGSTMISGGTWVEDLEYTLAGSIDSSFKEAQDKMVLYAGDLYYARVQGVYKMNITTGVSTLFFGKSGSGATHEILPNYSTTVSIHQSLDGTTPLMLIGLTFPDHTVAVNLLTNVLYWKSRMLSGPTPVALAVGS